MALDGVVQLASTMGEKLECVANTLVPAVCKNLASSNHQVKPPRFPRNKALHHRSEESVEVHTIVIYMCALSNRIRHTCFTSNTAAPAKCHVCVAETLHNLRQLPSFMFVENSLRHAICRFCLMCFSFAARC